MDFDWTENQKLLKKDAIKFAQNQKFETICDECEEISEFPRQLWESFAEYGVLGLISSEQYGGLGLDLMSCVAMMEGFGYGCKDAGILFSINAHLWSCVDPIQKYGSDYQKEHYLPLLCSGEWVGVHAMTEPDNGSDAYNLKTTAVETDNGFLINGSKTFITNGTIADLILVFAKTKNKNGKEVISCFLVERATEGLSVSKNIKKMGLRTSPFGMLYFNNCLIDKKNLLGQIGQGRHIFQSSMNGERTCILAANIGIMEKQIEECSNYSKIRKQFGKPIFDFQAISNRLAKMKVNLESARLLVYKAAWKRDKGMQTFLDSAIAKYYTSECCVQNSIDAMRIYGGYGYTKEYTVERQLRDSIGSLFYSGTSDIMLNLIAEMVD